MSRDPKDAGGVRRRRDVSREARKALRASLGRSPGKAPDHALVRAARVVETGEAVQCSHYGAPGGLYLAKLAPSPGRARTKPWQGRKWRSHGGMGAKVRRLDRQEALAVIRRPARRGPPGDDRIVELYWVPPELVVLLPRDRIKAMVTAGHLRAVWTLFGGREVQRGEPVISARGSARATGTATMRPSRSGA